MKTLKVSLLLFLAFIAESVIAQNDILPAANAISDAEKNIEIFKQEIANTRDRDLPIFDDRSFDSFIDEADFNSVNIKALKLKAIYPNFNKKGKVFKALATYKIVLSKNFYSVVVVVKKGDREMESVLINYDLKGNIIDHKLITYDEIIKSEARTTSKITKNKLSIENTINANQKLTKTIDYNITKNGKFKQVSNEDLLITNVIEQLNLEESKVNKRLIVTKAKPNKPEETIVVIPEIASKNDDFIEYNSHIVLVNNSDGKISHKYFESYKTNGWFSDAVFLEKISIDTAPYNITDSIRAFGIRVFYKNNSRPNPYNKSTLSLFVKSGNTLQKVLNDYMATEYSGIWDTICDGQFTEVKNVFILSKEKTNGFNTILVNSTIVDTTTYPDKNDDCSATEKHAIKKYILKYNGKVYE